MTKRGSAAYNGRDRGVRWAGFTVVFILAAQRAYGCGVCVDNAILDVTPGIFWLMMLLPLWYVSAFIILPGGGITLFPGDKKNAARHGAKPFRPRRRLVSLLPASLVLMVVFSILSMGSLQFPGAIVLAVTCAFSIRAGMRLGKAAAAHAGDEEVQHSVTAVRMRFASRFMYAACAIGAAIFIGGTIYARTIPYKVRRLSPSYSYSYPAREWLAGRGMEVEGDMIDVMKTAPLDTGSSANASMGALWVLNRIGSAAAPELAADFVARLPEEEMRWATLGLEGAVQPALAQLPPERLEEVIRDLEKRVPPEENGWIIMIRELEKKTPAGQAGFDVVITGAGERKIQLIKEVREATGLGLAEAKEFVETPPKAVREGLSRGEAEALKAKLEAAGAAVELRRGKGGGGGEEREGETGGGESIEAE